MFRVLIYYGDCCKTVYLPDAASCQEEIHLGASVTGWQRDCRVRFYALDGVWRISRPEGMLWQDDAQEPLDRRLTHGFNLAARDGDAQLGVYCTQCSVDNTRMRRYRTEKGFTIGKLPECDVVLSDEFISDRHGEVRVDGSSYAYVDSSKNGTYLNGRLIHSRQAELHIGDTLSWACGFKVVFFGSFFATNEDVALRSIRRAEMTGGISYPRAEGSGSSYDVLSRPPHFIPSLEKKSWKLEAPPREEEEQKQPLILTLGPSLTMSIPMLMGSFLAGSSGYAASGAIMMITSSALAVSWSLVNHFYGRNQRRKQLQARMEDYVARVQNTEEEIQGCIDEIMQTMNRTYPTAAECCSMTASCSDRIWEKGPGKDGFLTARVGNGMLELPYEISVPEKRMGEKLEGMANAPYALKERFDHLHQAPVTLDFSGNEPIGVVYGEQDVSAVQGLILQLAVLNSYNDLRVAVITGEEEGDEWHYLRWLPHTAMDNDPSAHLVASGRPAGQNVLNQLNEELLCRVENSENADRRKHYVLFCTDPELLARHPFMTNAMAADAGFSICVIARSEGELPRECRRVLHLPQKALYDHKAGQKVDVTLETASASDLRDAARRLARMRETERSENAAIPGKVTLLESFGVKKVEQLDIWRRWNQNSTGKDIRANLGLGAGARPFELNLSDKFHGPHGIVAGTTGSGKSVLLQTLVMSLALNYHPDELQFILIDYKGGGSFDCFRDLPHVVGTIDNLQGKRAINRALLSVRGEVMRREAIFKQLGVSDINTYIKRFNHDPAHQPLSHMVIIIDEFAELKDEMPDFMSELISTARIGRSVGLHLILATQKPSASVSGEIWSNSRFHICLRVQTREDSMEMLHRPEAAYIRGMGRGYVQVGNDELFEQIQSSWCGAPYLPDAPASGETPRLLDDAGVPVPFETPRQEGGVSELQQLTDVIIRIAAEHGVKGRGPLWLAELPAVTPLEDAGMPQKELPGALHVPFGLLDDVENQRYLPAVVNLVKRPNLLFVGRATTGKTTALQTMACAISRMYTPNEVQMLVLGLSGMQLHSLGKLPGVIDFTSGREVREQRRLIGLLENECTRRDDLFARVATDNITAYNREMQSTGGKPLPALVVLADRLAQWFEPLPDAEQERLSTLIKTAAGRGVYFICTAMERREVPSSLRDAFMCLPLNQESLSEYSELLGCRMPQDMAVPQLLPGRGVMRTETGIYEFQLAVAFGEANDALRSRRIAAWGQEQTADCTPVMQVVHVPEVFDGAFLRETAERVGVAAPELLPAAIDHQSARPVMLDVYEKNNVFVYGKAGTGKTSVLKALASARAGERGQVFVLESGNEWHGWCRAHGAHYATVEGSQIALTSALDDAFRERLMKRKSVPNYTDPAVARRIALEMPPLVIVMDDVDKWLDQTKDNGQPYLEKQLASLIGSAMEKGANYGICVMAGCAAAGMSSAMPNEAVRRLKDKGWGVACGNTLADVNPWNADLPYSRETQNMKAGEGFFVNNGAVSRVLLPAE